MRIISGIYKGKIIKGHNIEGTRPTMDRVKESLFSMIQLKIKNSVCLDLFAGSGNLGIECISNGSRITYFVDNNIQAIKTLKENLNVTLEKIKSTMCNCGSVTIGELHKKARLTMVSGVSIREGGAHDVMTKDIE